MATDLAELERRLWEAADELRANSKLTAHEYRDPVLGLIFLAFAEERFDAAREEVEASGGKRRKPGPDDYKARGVLYVADEARLSTIASAEEGADIGQLLNDAMRALERDNTELAGVLPQVYARLEKTTLVELIRLVAPLVRSIEGDAFGQIYEYFLAAFALQEGRGGGEFFTPASIVSLLVEVIEPYHGRILDPACGSGGMFVHSAKFVNRHKREAASELSIYGIELKEATLPLSKMNLALHGLGGEVVEGNSYYVDDPDATPVVMPKDIVDGCVATQGVARIGRQKVDELAHHQLLEGDIVLARRGDVVGRCAWIGSEEAGYLCGTGSMRISGGSGELDPRFLFYALLSEECRSWLQRHAVGSTMSNLNADIVRELPIPHLPMAVQLRIADVLTAMDELIENNRRRIEILEETARSLYREWFVRYRFPGHDSVEFVKSSLGPIPAGWTVDPLFDQADVAFGFAFKSKGFSEEGALPVVRIRDIPVGRSRTRTDEFPGDRYLVENGDSLIGMDGEFHMRRWSGGTALLNQRVARVRPSRDLGPQLLHLSLERPIQDLNRTITGTTVAHLGKRHLEQVEVLVPEPRLLDEANARLDQLGQLSIELSALTDLLASARDALLPKLVTGQIDVDSLGVDDVFGWAEAAAAQ